MNQIKHLARQIQLNLENRRVIRAKRDKQRALFMAGFTAFNNGPTCFAGNRENGDKTRVNVDRIYLFR